MTTELANDGYQIGAVSRITGIGTETLRAWERRYSAVTPRRTISGNRKYSRDDVSKLMVLKSLVDSGIAISSIAQLSLEELNANIESDPILSKASSISNKTKENTEPCNVLLIGEGFPIRILDGLEEVNGINVIEVHDTFDELENSGIPTDKYDVVIIEKPTINKYTRKEIEHIRLKTKALHMILIYGFSTQESIDQIRSSQTSVVRSSVDVQELARLCIFHTGGSEQLPSLQANSTLHFEQTIPTRRFSNQQLSELAKLSDAIKCECPRHMSDLVKDLVAFEIYSAECENENKEDAELHSYLHATTAQARSMLEEALLHLVRVEDIKI